MAYETTHTLNNSNVEVSIKNFTLLLRHILKCHGHMQNTYDNAEALHSALSYDCCCAGQPLIFFERTPATKGVSQLLAGKSSRERRQNKPCFCIKDEDGDGHGEVEMTRKSKLRMYWRRNIMDQPGKTPFGCWLCCSSHNTQEKKPPPGCTRQCGRTL